MKTSTRIAAASALLAALAGCVSFGPQEAQHYYVLDAAPANPGAGRTPRASTLLVAPTTASSFYETQEIVYSRTPGMRAYYQFHNWAERPARRVTDLLVTCLERDRSFQSVATAVSGVQGNVLLSTHLIDFYHDAATAPGSAKVSITAELMDPARRVLLARRTFDRSMPAATYDAPGAVQAFNQAVAAILDDIAAWVDASAPR